MVCALIAVISDVERRKDKDKDEDDEVLSEDYPAALHTASVRLRCALRLRYRFRVRRRRCCQAHERICGCTAFLLRTQMRTDDE